MSTYQINNGDLYRLPWTLPDNGISWLEPTAECNLTCDGCYRENEKNAHKSFEEVLHELNIFQKLRKTDCISIAGGDPLVYPQIVDLVAEIRCRDLKPIINTNGHALTKELLRDLHRAGVFGFTFHVDSNQGRPGEWAGKNEAELNELRLTYAQMLAEHKTIACSFNSTVYEENIQDVPEMISWAHKHIDIVHTMVFICFRHVIPKMQYDWYAGVKKVPWDTIMYHSEGNRKVDIKSTDLVNITRAHFPDFEPAAFLNGTEEPDAYKWLLSERIGTRNQIYGYVGPKFIELIMGAYHFFKDRYISYASPRFLGAGRSATLLLWPFDRKLRRITARYLIDLLKNPFRIFNRLHIQTIMFIQPVDIVQDGRQSMCDGCPDITVYDDKLVWSCRLEELKNFGTFLRSVPKRKQPMVKKKEFIET